MARSKAYEPLRRFVWSVANRAANNAFEMAALVGAMESVSRFVGAGESLAKAIVLIEPIAPSGLTFSLGHLLIDSIFGTAIAIVHSDRGDCLCDNRDGVRRRASRRLTM